MSGIAALFRFCSKGRFSFLSLQTLCGKALPVVITATELGKYAITTQRLQAQKTESTLAAKPKQSSNTAQSASKLSFKEQKELAEIPTKIEQLETEQAQINQQLADSELYKAQAEKVKNLQARLLEIESLLETLLSRWATLDKKFLS